MANRKHRAQIAKQTLDILRQGHYCCISGKKIFLQDALALAIKNTVLYRPQDFSSMIDKCEQISSTVNRQTKFEVTQETTLGAAQRLVNAGHEKVLCLNFASAKNPGGGFLGGSQAQEESLARASGLYASISLQTEYYQQNRHCHTCLYTDNMIYSPDVPVFRNDDDILLEQPYNVSIITAPAVNRGAVERNERRNKDKIYAVMSARINKLLSLCVIHEHAVLVLGAWGCGVFRNSPQTIANLFNQHLQQNLFAKFFSHIVFAVYDRSRTKDAFTEFKKTFAH